MSYPQLARVALGFALALVNWSAMGLAHERSPHDIADGDEPGWVTTLVKAQTSGPDIDSPVRDGWVGEYPDDAITSPHDPAEVFEEPADDCVPDSSGSSAIRSRAIIDSALTWTTLTEVDGFGVTDIEARSSLVIPYFVNGSPLRLALGFGTSFFDAPSSLDLPDQVYGLQAELRWLLPIREGLAVDVGAGTGWFSDFNSGTRGFRVTGRVILIKDLTPNLKGSIGFLYLGRENLKAMPIAGLIYTPREDLRVELLIPRSRVAWRVRRVGDRDHWVYAGTELFGGNSWATEHSDGTNDIVSYRDYRLLVGYETKAQWALSGRAELGYVFARKVEFDKSPTVLEPDGTVLFRVGVGY